MRKDSFKKRNVKELEMPQLNHEMYERSLYTALVKPEFIRLSPH